MLDIGAGEDPHPAATTTLDQVALPGVDVVHDITERPWPIEESRYNRVVAQHVLEHVEQPQEVFKEVSRVLTPTGRFDVTVPIGLDARTDPTHVHEWTYDTPEYFVQDPPYDYGWQLPFELDERDVTWWCDGPFADTENEVADWVAAHGYGKWLSGVPGLSGELTAVYRRCRR